MAERARLARDLGTCVSCFGRTEEKQLDDRPPVHICRECDEWIALSEDRKACEQCSGMMMVWVDRKVNLIWICRTCGYGLSQFPERLEGANLSLYEELTSLVRKLKQDDAKIARTTESKDLLIVLRPRVSMGQTSWVMACGRGTCGICHPI